MGEFPESGGDYENLLLGAAAISECRALAGLKETARKKLLMGALIAGSFFPFEAIAQERAGDAALGAVSGAVVLGPVGAVAGALIGYTAGPSIARSWGVGRSASRPQARRAAHSSRTEDYTTQGSVIQ